MDRTTNTAISGTELRNMRKKLGLTQQELADKLAFSVATVSKSERHGCQHTAFAQALYAAVSTKETESISSVDSQALPGETKAYALYQQLVDGIAALYHLLKVSETTLRKTEAALRKASAEKPTSSYRALTGEEIAERKLTAERIIRERREKQERDEQRKVIADLQAKLFSIALEADKPKYHAAVNAEINKEMAQRHVRKHVQAFLDAATERVVHANDPLVTLAEEDTQ